MVFGPKVIFDANVFRSLWNTPETFPERHITSISPYINMVVENSPTEPTRIPIWRSRKYPPYELIALHVIHRKGHETWGASRFHADCSTEGIELFPKSAYVYPVRVPFHFRH